jgi:uncharacterized protein (TIGR03435 family)
MSLLRSVACAILAAGLWLDTNVGYAQALPWRDARNLPAFEVASIKASPPTDAPRWTSRFSTGMYQATNITTRNLIKQAYGLVLNEQIAGAPDWIDSLRFDVQATAPGIDVANLRLMLQRLLIERFRFAGQSARVERPVFALTRVRNDGILGPGLKRIGDSCEPPAIATANSPLSVDRLQCNQSLNSGGVFMARGISMPRFAELLSTSIATTGVDRLVLDGTSLDGLYSVDVRFLQPESPGLRKPESPDGVEFPTAIKEQLGLKLDPVHAPVDTIVVTTIEKPAPN